MHVLVIEDHDDLREATMAVLEANGFVVDGISAAEELDDYAQHERPSLYVVDLNLPGEDGLSLTRRLRSGQPGAGIVMTTARTQIQDRVKGYESGADIYLPKPVSPEELVAALQALATRIQIRESACPGGVWLDTTVRTLHGPHGEVKLSDAETRLLSAMATAREGMLERWQVAVQLGAQDAEISRDSLQNRISQLRKKMSASAGEGEFIRSVRKEGYKLCVDLKLRA